MKRAILTAVLMSSALLGTSAMALTAQQTVEREVVVKNLDGTETVRREKADTVVPGENIVYSINYYNDLDKAAENVVLVMPVPAELTLIEGSADIVGAETTFSADGGKSFASREISPIIRLDGRNQMTLPMLNGLWQLLRQTNVARFHLREN